MANWRHRRRLRRVTVVQSQALVDFVGDALRDDNPQSLEIRQNIANIGTLLTQCTALQQKRKLKSFSRSSTSPQYRSGPVRALPERARTFRNHTLTVPRGLLFQQHLATIRIVAQALQISYGRHHEYSLQRLRDERADDAGQIRQRRSDTFKGSWEGTYADKKTFKIDVSQISGFRAQVKYSSAERSSISRC